MDCGSISRISCIKELKTSLTIMKSLILISVLAASCSAAPQLLYTGYPGYAATVHAVPTVAKQTITYKTAAFEPVEADTPADAKLIELKETEHKHDILVPGPTQYISSPAIAYTHALGYAGLPLAYHGLPVVAAPAVAAEAEAEE